jgi:phosphoribosylformylglycinamidine cyclo-ligase
VVVTGGESAATPLPAGGDALTYSAAGVDIEAGERAVELMKEWVAIAQRPETVGGIGGFAGLFDASALAAYRRPLLATSTDGVGTKVVIAQQMGVHDTIGFDLVGMVVDDIVVYGAEPLFMTDYIVCGRVVPERVAAIVKGIAQACMSAGCALAGGETAEHPGLHANGYALVRTVLDRAGWDLDHYVPELGQSIGAELLEPTRIYASACLALARSAEVDVHAFAHVTGGGIAANLARMLPASVSARVDRATWSASAVFGLLGTLGNVAPDELERTLNMGVGLVAVVAADDGDDSVRLLGHHGVPAWIAGEIVRGDGTVALA